MKKSIYLNDLENEVIQLLAKGKRYRIIRDLYAKAGENKYNFHAFLAFLRKKTGIKDTNDMEECANFLAKTEQSAHNPPLSQQQKKVLEHYLKRDETRFIAERIGMTNEQTLKLIEDTLAQCGIFAKDPQFQRSQIRLYFALNGSADVKAEPSQSHWQILRAIANGEDLAELGFHPSALKFLTREACIRANAVAPGRNARLKLIRAFLAAHDAKHAITMDDPAF